MHVSWFSDITLGRYILFQLHVKFVNAITQCLSATHHTLIISRFPLLQTLLYRELNVVSCSLYRTRVIVVQSDHAASWFKRRHFCLLFGRLPFRVSTGTPTFSTSCVVSLSLSRRIPVMSCSRPRQLPPYLQLIILTTLVV